MSINPVAGLQPNRSAGFLFKNPFKTLEAFTESDLGIRIGFSRITTNEKGIRSISQMESKIAANRSLKPEKIAR